MEIPDEEMQSTHRYVFDLPNKLKETCQLVRQTLLRNQNRYKPCFDRRTQIRDLKVGDKVLVLLPSNANKLLMQWQGPFEVVE